MPSPLVGTIIDVQDAMITVLLSDGQRILLPISAVMGKPVKEHPLYLIAATSDIEANKQHPLAQTMLEQLLDSSEA